MRGADDVAQLLDAAVLGLSLVQLGRRRLPACIGVHATQAASVAAATGWRAWQQGSLALALAAVLILGVQGVAMVVALRRTTRQLRPSLAIASWTTRLATLAFAGMLAALALLLVPAVPALAVVLVGALGVVARRDALGQTIGLLVVGNGVLLAAAGMPGLAPVLALAVPVLPGVLLFGIGHFGLRDGFDIADGPVP